VAPSALPQTERPCELDRPARHIDEESGTADDDRPRLTARIGEIALEFERLLKQQEARFAQEERRESTMAAALRRFTTDPDVDVVALKRLSEEMKQRFIKTMTEFTARLERLKGFHEETISIAARLERPEHEAPTDSAPTETS